MTILHIVMFEPLPTASASDISGACERMKALKTNCLHPSTQQPYIKSLVGGKQNSKEGVKVSFEYGFIVEFESASDRDYYTAQDPAHRAFVQSLAGVAELPGGVGVLDFEPGVF